MPAPSSLTDDDKDDLLLACRYGDLEDVQTFVTEHGPETLNEIHDNNGNCVLHMVCANGHTDLLNYLLPLLPPTIISAKNHSGSTPLHWAALNSHLDIAQKLVQHPLGPGRDLIEIKNIAGRSPLGEAELAGWEEGAKWFVQVMNLDHDEQEPEGHEGEGDATSLDTESGIDHDIEVEIQDADGQIAKMTISGTSASNYCNTKTLESDKI